MNRWRPTLISGADFMKMELSPEEGFLLSRIDGATTATELGLLTRQSVPNLCFMLWRLVQNQVLEPVPARLTKQIAAQVLMAMRQSQVVPAVIVPPPPPAAAPATAARAESGAWSEDGEATPVDFDALLRHDDASFGESEPTAVEDQAAIEALMANMRQAPADDAFEPEGAEPSTETGPMPWEDLGE
ncbi:MAG: hypothetical protein ABIJ09_11850 [Pseudomonadota bacterium]